MALDLSFFVGYMSEIETETEFVHCSHVPNNVHIYRLPPDFLVKPLVESN